MHTIDQCSALEGENDMVVVCRHTVDWRTFSGHPGYVSGDLDGEQTRLLDHVDFGTHFVERTLVLMFLFAIMTIRLRRFNFWDFFLASDDIS